MNPKLLAASFNSFFLSFVFNEYLCVMISSLNFTIYCYLLWLMQMIVYRYELLFYPRYHLDQSSLLCRKPLLAKPMVMDVYEDYILVTYRPFDLHIFHVKLFGELSPSSTPDLQVKECYAVSFFSSLLLKYKSDSALK